MPTSPMDADRPKKLGGRVMGVPRYVRQDKEDRRMSNQQSNCPICKLEAQDVLREFDYGEIIGGLGVGPR